MKKFIIPALIGAIISLGACTDNKSDSINDGRYHPPGEKTHHDYAPGDTLQEKEHQHEPGDTTYRL